MTTDIPADIDHLVYTTLDLERGMDHIASLLGVRPVFGGRHPRFGTHNALISLGNATYLEIMAPDQDLPAPARGRLFAEAYRAGPKMTTWVLRTEQIDAMQEHAVQSGLALGAVETGQRERPNGTRLSWKLTDPYAFPHDGAIPFLISWGATPHPATTSPQAGELIGFKIQHPDPELISAQLNALNVHVEVIEGAQTKCIARIRTGRGIVSLE